jgi:mannitol-specific phosphotransferase system IIBC component
MKIKKKILSVTVLMLVSMLVIALPVLAQEQSAQEVEQEQETVATIDGDEVYMSELEQSTNLQGIMMQLQRQSPAFVEFLYTSEAGEEFREAFKKDQLDDLIDEKLMEREAERE